MCCFYLTLYWWPETGVWLKYILCKCRISTSPWASTQRCKCLKIRFKQREPKWWCSFVVNPSKTWTDHPNFPSSTLSSTSVSVIQRPISFRGSSSCSSPPSPQPPPPWPSRWLWSQARWLFPACRAGCPPMTAKPQPAATAPGRSRCGSRRCGGDERKGSCWRRGEVRSHSSRDFLVEQQQRQISECVRCINQAVFFRIDCCWRLRWCWRKRCFVSLFFEMLKTVG